MIELVDLAGLRPKEAAAALGQPGRGLAVLQAGLDVPGHEFGPGQHLAQHRPKKDPRDWPAR